MDQHSAVSAVLEAQADGAAGWDRLLPVGVDGGRPKVLNRTALGPTTGDKAHSPFGAY
ncbi:hypothetical protein [Streptomyces sp. 900116325]